MTPHSVPQFPMWIPYLWVSPTSNAGDIVHALDERLRIYSNGSTFYMPQRQIDFHCEFDVSLFPFDSHRCVPHFESRRYNELFQKLHLNEFHLSDSNQHGHWMVELGDCYEVTPEYVSGTFSAAEFVIFIRRKPVYFAVSLILPLGVILLAESATFLLPIDSSDRLQLSFTTLLAFSFFSSTISTELPHDSDHMPIILVVINMYTASISIIIIIQAVAIYLSGKNNKNFAKLCNLVSIVVFTLTLVIGTIVVTGINPILSTQI